MVPFSLSHRHRIQQYNISIKQPDHVTASTELNVIENKLVRVCTSILKYGIYYIDSLQLYYEANNSPWSNIVILSIVHLLCFRVELQ